jgi:urea transporter
MTEVTSAPRVRWWHMIDGTMPQWAVIVARRPLLAFLDHCLRGVGQIVFVNNPISGFGILLAMWLSSGWVALAVAVGALVSTATAQLLGMERDLIANGLYGFNGALVTGALALLMSPPWSVAVLAYGAVGAAASTVLMAALVRIFIGTWGVPPVTLPFNLLTMAMLACVVSIKYLHVDLPTRTLPFPEADTAMRHAADAPAESGIEGLTHAFVHGLGTLVLSANFVSGVVVLVAMAVCSRILAVMGLAGSAMGALTGLVLGGDGALLHAGFWGFNSFICAVGIALFYVFTWRTGVFALACAVVGALLYGALQVLLSPVGLPPLTLPFCLATLMFLLARDSSTHLVGVPLDRVSTPEEHRRWWRAEQETAH